MDDLISRQLLREAMYHEAFEVDSDMQKWDGGCWIRYKLFEKILDNLPTIQPEQKTGRWEIVGEEVGALNIRYAIKKCSECGWKHSLCIPESFCPNCGAKMESEG